ncbi:peptide/nickel transport system substrate-binding protein [Leucobacter luti]|uniref:ABC transporter substrate-binding protein n=1 Tax=Leucobacter luti TaxID=340320 RepID=UPI001048E2A1|nr:ABC transporter substrate-binding protein [Leucobacter luti]MCW2289911.1 peptide/nickel transport system substrate-binding protein [Leucobacter luti]TCK36080.1 peptide/nickel transport system substrate-binding protein [Leucobacter luti]
MKIWTRRAAAVMIAAVLALTASACAPGGSGAGENFLRVGTTSLVDSLNPFVSDSDYSSVLYQYVYPHLTEYDENLEIVPSFAESWESSEDGKTWTFTTVADQQWSDGKSLTARDVAFTANMIVEHQAGPTGILAGWVAHLQTAEAIDDTTVVFHYESPVANVLTQVQALHILPEHIWAPLAQGDGSEITTFDNAAPIVSGGPFIMEKYEKDQLMMFSGNENWYGTKPKIDGFGFQFFANDDAMVSALKSGQVDMIGQMTPPTAVQTLKDAGMTVETGPSVTIKNVIINTNPDKPEHRELLVPEVRQALEYAIDRSEIVDQTYLGHAAPGGALLSPATGFANESISGLPFDIAAANSILDGLGYARGADGIRVADGVPMKYELVFPTEESGSGDRAFQTMQRGWEEIGVLVEQRKMDPDAAWDAITAPDNQYLEYDIAMWNWTPPVEPDFILSTLTCGSWGNNSDSGYCNPRYDELYAAQAIELDEAKRRAIIDEMQQIIFDDRPYIVYVNPQVIEAHSPQWTGFVLSPLVGSINNLSTQTLTSVERVAS